MKKIKKVLTIILIILISIIGLHYLDLFVNVALWQNETNKRTYVSTFDEYKDDFDTIAKAMIKHEKEIMKEYVIVDFAEDGTKNKALYPPPTYKPIKLNKKEIKSLNNVCKCFDTDGGDFYSIEITKSKLRFFIDNDSFVVIYSRDGIRPKNLGGSHSGGLGNYYVKNLGNHWYSVTGT